MNTEQLKMILDALQSLGAEGKDAFIWWLVVHHGVGPLTWLITFAGIIILVRWIVGLVRNSWQLDRIAAALGMSDYEQFSDRDYQNTIKKAADYIARTRNESHT